MKLPGQDVELFFRLYGSLMVYVSKKFNILNLNSPGDFMKTPLERIRKLREKFYAHPELIDSFVKENPYHLSPRDLEVISEWKHFLKGEFIILRSLKEHTIFLDTEEPKAYGVLGLYSMFEEIVGPLPVMAETVLLPFKGKIITDGILIAHSILFGRGIRDSFNDSYQEAQFTHGIITSLPFSEKEGGEKSDEDKLRFYMKSERNQFTYEEEIAKLLKKNPKLLSVYHEEVGKSCARKLGRILHDSGVMRGWFAILEGMLIAGGRTREEVEKIVGEIVSADKKDFVYIFQLKERK